MHVATQTVPKSVTASPGSAEGPADHQAGQLVCSKAFDRNLGNFIAIHCMWQLPGVPPQVPLVHPMCAGISRDRT